MCTLKSDHSDSQAKLITQLQELAVENNRLKMTIEEEKTRKPVYFTSTTQTDAFDQVSTSKNVRYKKEYLSLLEKLKKLAYSLSENVNGVCTSPDWETRSSVRN